jgi:FKBP-type peptidyl-prolyl cis-trans isomerase FkpA
MRVLGVCVALSLAACAAPPRESEPRESVLVIAARERQASEEFLRRAAAEPGALRTASGLVFREIEAGTGPRPAPADTATLRYRATLRDDRPLDSSAGLLTPPTVLVGTAIPCLSEGLQLMRVGGVSRIACPAELVHFDQARGIPAGAAVVLEVELLDVRRPLPVKGH